MPFTTAQLKAELQGDPTALGYAAKYNANDPQGAADLLNAVNPSINVKRSDITPAEVLEAIDSRDFIASPNLAQCSWFESITQFPRIRLLKDDGTNTTVRGNLNRLVNDTNGSQTRVLALASRTGSRAEQLWGAGTVVTASDVANALVS